LRATPAELVFAPPGVKLTAFAEEPETTVRSARNPELESRPIRSRRDAARPPVSRVLSDSPW
jgi:hypothetical protein